MEKLPESQGRGKPRDEKLRESILGASAELLLENGFKKFTIEGVAARAKASKVTIYKWWPSKGCLALDGFVHVITESITFARTRSPRKDVENQLAALIRMLTGTPAGRAIMELIGAAQEDPELKRELNVRYIQPRREIAGLAFARLLGWNPVEKKEALYAVTDQVYGAIYNRLLFGLTPLDEDFARRLVEFWVAKTPPKHPKGSFQ
jgi:AcrR family transcriptional regulator